MGGDRQAPRAGTGRAPDSEPQIGAGAGGAGTGGPRSGAVDAEIDAEGLLCPLPVLRAGRVLREMAPGTLLRLRATDPVAVVDVPHYCAEAGHALVSADHGADGVSVYLIRRGPG